MNIEDRANPCETRFVLLHHLMPAQAKRKSHWDLMIEAGSSLLTFELITLPGITSLATRATSIPTGLFWTATRLPDHRLDYLDYQGPIAAAQACCDRPATDRGRVVRIARGHASCQALASGGPMQCQLDAPELFAQFTYQPCEVGQCPGLVVSRWEWRSS